MKKIYIILTIIILLTISILLIFNNEKNIKYIKYNGHKLALSVNGQQVTTMPTGNYFLVSYDCINGTELNWDYQTSTLTADDYQGNDMCSLAFESSPTIYSLTDIGDYIEYTGNNGCDEIYCSGFNANQLETEIGELDTYGYCYDEYEQFYTYGWRVLYKDDNSVYIVSAGAPECIAGISSNSTETITNLNVAALKYCNENYLSNGICNETTAHSFKNVDFYNFTNQFYGDGYYLYNYGDGGTPYCYDKVSKKCGYNNDIIDNGSYYWFGSAYSDIATLTFSLSISIFRGRKISYETSSNLYGLRPVLKLDSSILATGGSGTMDDPYIISERIVE